MDLRKIIKDSSITPPYNSTKDDDWVNYYLQVIALRHQGYITPLLSPKQRARVYKLLTGKANITKLEVEETRKRTGYIYSCCGGVAWIDWKTMTVLVCGCSGGYTDSISFDEAIHATLRNPITGKSISGRSNPWFFRPTPEYPVYKPEYIERGKIRKDTYRRLMLKPL